MGHELYEDGTFTGAYFGRQSGWHTLGLTDEESAEPVEAYAKLGVGRERAETLYLSDGRPTNWSVIMRDGKDGKPIVVSEPVAGTWFWLPHAEAAEIASRATGGHKVETIGVIGAKRGDIMFCTFPMREVKVVGEEHKQYVFFLSSLRRGTASVLGVTDVRMVCWNTIELGISRAQSIFKAGHRPNVVADTLAWFQEVWGTAQDRGDEIVACAEHLATIRVNEKMLAEAMVTILPFRPEPRATGSSKRDKDNATWVAAANARTAQAHSLVVDLFNGKGAGLGTAATADNAWGAYNAVAEYVDHYVPARGGEVARAEFALVGDGVQIKSRAAKVLGKL